MIKFFKQRAEGTIEDYTLLGDPEELHDTSLMVEARVHRHAGGELMWIGKNRDMFVTIDSSDRITAIYYSVDTVQNTVIVTIDDLDEYMQAKHPEIYTHVQQHERDLPSYSVDRLKGEGVHLWSYCLACQGDKPTSNVPHWYGCGLLSRCLSLAIADNRFISPAFFEQFGYTPGQAGLLREINWY